MAAIEPVDTPWLTSEEAARYLKFPSTRWFRMAVRKYGIPTVRRGRRLFFHKQELDEFMAVADEATNPRRGGTRARNV